MGIVRAILARLQAAFAWWLADIQRRPSLIGKAASLGIGLIVICCVCSVGLGAVRGTGQAVGLVATNTPSPRPTNTPEATDTPEPTSSPAPTPASVPTVTPVPATSEPPTEVPTSGPTNTPAPTDTPLPPTPIPSFADQVQAVVKASLTRSNRELERISTVEAEPEGDIYVQWTINDNLTENMVKTGAKIDIKDLLKAIHDSGLSYKRVILEGSFPLVDALGNSKEAIVVHAEYPRATIDAINWSNFLHKNVYVIGEKVKIHPAFREE